MITDSPLYNYLFSLSLSLSLSLIRVALCQGKFPDFLIDAWDEYDFRKDSDNDRPSKILREYLL